MNFPCSTAPGSQRPTCVTRKRSGQLAFGAPLYDEGLFTVDISLADIRRERIALPLLRDERPELQVRELGRIVAERADLAPDSTASPEEEALDAPRPIKRRLRVADAGEP